MIHDLDISLNISTPISFLKMTPGPIQVNYIYQKAIEDIRELIINSVLYISMIQTLHLLWVICSTTLFWLNSLQCMLSVLNIRTISLRVHINTLSPDIPLKKRLAMQHTHNLRIISVKTSRYWLNLASLHPITLLKAIIQQAHLFRDCIYAQIYISQRNSLFHFTNINNTVK